MRNTLLTASVSICLLAITPTTRGDVVISLDSATWDAGQFQIYFAPGGLHGVLTGVSLCTVTSDNPPHADALTVYVTSGPFSPEALAGDPFFPPTGGRLQVGGFQSFRPLDLGAEESAAWPVPQNPDFILNATYTLADGGFDVASFAILLGSGIAPPPSGDLYRSWSGLVKLHGVSHVPAPGAMAILAMAAITGRPRRRR
jgi:hypothetical protein